MHTGSVNESMSESSDVTEHLEKFGVPKKRLHVVLSAPSRPSHGGAERRIENLAPDDWRPAYPATRRLDERVPFAWHLSGIDPERVDMSEYDWVAGG